MSGQHEGTYDGLLVGASAVLTTAETMAICPFDLAPALPPEKVDLQNATFERFSVPRKYARPLASQGFESLEGQECEQLVAGRCATACERADHRSLQPADAAAGLDHGVSLPGPRVPLPAQWPDRSAPPGRPRSRGIASAERSPPRWPRYFWCYRCYSPGPRTAPTDEVLGASSGGRLIGRASWKPTCGAILRAVNARSVRLPRMNGG